MGEHNVSRSGIHHESHRTLPKVVFYGGQVAESWEEMDGWRISRSECRSDWSRGDVGTTWKPVFLLFDACILYARFSLFHILTKSAQWFTFLGWRIQPGTVQDHKGVHCEEEGAGKRNEGSQTNQRLQRQRRTRDWASGHYGSSDRATAGPGIQGR